MRSDTMSEQRLSEQRPEADPQAPFMQDEGFVRWIPVVVPLFALMLTIAVFFIGAEVL